MPRRNIAWLILVAILSLVCYQQVPANRYGRVLANVMDRVSRDYYLPIQGIDLFEGAMRGMVGQLDENSEYIPPAQKQAFEELITKQFPGIGASVEIDPKSKQLTVGSPLVGTPAYEAKIRPGDKILKIDGRSTQGMPLKDAVDRIRGKPGTAVVLTILHEGDTQPTEITIVRRIIQEDTVLGDTRNPDGTWNYFLAGPGRIGYVRVTAFAEAERSDESGTKAKTTVADLREVLDKLVEQGMRGLVLDLRENPGGALLAAVGVCDLFISSGEIVTVRGRAGKIEHLYRASGTAPFTDFPMAVLVNEHSASASEIVAACLQDNHRAAIVGQQTYGKGTVQDPMDLGEAGELKLTVATYWRPSGVNIHRNRREEESGATWGVLPDPGLEVVVDKEEFARFFRWRQDRDAPGAAAGKAPPDETARPFVDRPLARAVEYLRSRD
jgi:carboxyl-terminal processing protease